MWRLCFFALLLLIIGTPVGAHDLGSNFPYKFEFAGKDRRYSVHVPDSVKGKRVPLVVVLHGGLTNAWFVGYESKLTAKADKDGFIVAYPQGTGGLGRSLLTWNAGGCCGPAKSNGSDDVGFIRDVISRIQKDHEIDADRIYVAGSSNGGMMAYRIAAELGDVVAAVASVNGCMMTNDFRPKEPVSVVAFNGTKDNVIKLNGGTGSMLGYKIKCPPAEETMADFAAKLGCSPQAKTEIIGDVTKEIYSGAPGNVEVCLYIAPTAHFWPGGRRPYPRLSSDENELSATDVMCEFFWAHPKYHAVAQTSIQGTK